MEPQNAQAINQKKAKQGSPDVQFQTEENNQGAVMCPNCNAELPPEALYCPECGFSRGHICPKCSAPASPTADICESCGSWLLEGQCIFCYAEIPEEALFCPECGKPKNGISCPHCGKLSIFDFCPGCGKPLTEEAIAELQLAQKEMQNHAQSDIQGVEAAEKTFSSNQEARRWYNAHNPAAQTAKIDAELAQLEAIINSEPERDPEPEEKETESPSVKKSLFSSSQLAAIRKTGAAVDEVARQRIEAERIAEEKRKAEEAERKRKEKERQRKIKEAQERKEALERELRARRWRCNAYGAVHSSPNECSCPSMGGVWL